MKRLVLLIALVCISMTGFAQTQIAVLQHNDTITNTFYGPSAFVNAYNAAADGDIITLSEGSFKSCTIAKALTIRGAGARSENENGMTYLTPSFLIKSTTSTVQFEGVNLSPTSVENGCSLQLVRCIVNNLHIGTKNTNVSLINCLIEDFSNSGTSGGGDCTINCVNCVLYKASSLDFVSIYNSYIKVFRASNINQSSLINCILARSGEWDDSAGSTNVFSNCVAINMSKLYNDLAGGIGSNTHVSSMSDVFETFTGGGSMNYYEEYILNEDFATSFPGNDGTEVGIHGGIMPFSLDPSYMIVKRCNVAGKSTIDGKLSVDIEIDTEE